MRKRESIEFNEEQWASLGKTADGLGLKSWRVLLRKVADKELFVGEAILPGGTPRASHAPANYPDFAGLPWKDLPEGETAPASPVLPTLVRPVPTAPAKPVLVKPVPVPAPKPALAPAPVQSLLHRRDGAKPIDR